MVDEQKLRELAEAATPGPWMKNCAGGAKRGESFKITEFYVYAPDTQDDTAVCADVIDPATQEPSEINAAYIAAANPAAILPLLDELQTLRSERTAWRVTAENAEKDRDDADRMSKALAAVCDKNDARWKFLHTINKDAQGFEWCVMRVKWENGRISEALHTNSDMSDMDAAIDAAMKDES